MTIHLYLAKANEDLVCFCKCNDALISYPPQMDCPWCGCGWLFTCITCRKAFTFAKVVQTDQSWEDLARLDLRGRTGVDPPNPEIAKWIEFMKVYLRSATLGDTYVALDGRIISIKQTRVDFDGWHATHKLDFVPQVAAMTDQSVRDKILSNEEYWQSHALGEMAPSSLGLPAIRDRDKKWWRFWR